MGRRDVGRDRRGRKTRPADRRPYALCCIAIVLAGLAYVNTLDHPFVYDDQVTVVTNRSLEDLGNLRRIVVGDLFRPVVNLSYALDRALWGLAPLGFHLSSILLHMLSVALLFALARRAAGDGWRRTSRETPDPVTTSVTAFVAASLFAVHPMMSEAVGYVSGRSELLCTVFSLLALLALRRRFLGGSLIALAGGLVALLLALGAKETAAGIPLFLLLYDRWLLPGGDAARRRLLRYHLPLLALVAVGAVVRLASFVTVETGGELVNVWHNLLVESTVVWRYLRLMAIPFGQSIVHDVHEVIRLEPGAAAALLGLALLVSGLVALRRRAPLVALGGLWFLVLLAPSHLVPLAEPMAEHRVYTASCGLFLALASVLGPRLGPRLRALLMLAPVLALLTGLTVARNRVWADPVTLWRDAVDHAPGAWAAQYSLGNALRGAGRCPEAVAAFERAVRLKPRRLEAYWNLAICLAESKRLSEAQAILEAAYRIDPSNPKTTNNLATLAWISGDPRAAERHLQRSLRLDPANLQARRVLALLCEEALGDPGRALALYREILALAPGTPGVRERIHALEAAGAAGDAQPRPAAAEKKASASSSPTSSR